MSKAALYGIIAVVVVVGGYFAYRATQGPSDSGTMVEEDGSADNGGSTTSVAELMRQGGNTTCTFTSEEDGNRTDGTVYLSDSKMRGDFTIAQTDGTNFDFHTIMVDGYAYSWGGPFGNQGTKMKIDANAQASSGDNTEFNQNKSMDMDCDSWRADNSKFVPPSDVNFQDISVQVQPSPGSTGQTQNSQCGTCDQSGDEQSRQACRQALGC